MSARGWAGFSRFDDALAEADAAEPDVDLEPYSENPDYQARRRDAQLAHYREQLRIAETYDAPRAVMWERLIGELERAEHWSSGAGDRKLF